MYSPLITMKFRGMDLVSIRDLTVPQMNRIMDVAEEMVPIAKGEKVSKLLDGKILATLFYEPSTRTKLSFESAMMRLGGRVIGFSDPKSSSVAKGETLADTIRMADAYSDLIVLRYRNEGAARLAADFSEVPVINAGDGAGQHPTQTLLDLFTIREEMGEIKGKNIALLGDLKYGRTVHSLSEALAMFGAKLSFVSPKGLEMPTETVESVEKIGTKPHITNCVNDVIADSDILYVTRIQKERFADLAEYKKVAGSFQVNAELLEKAKKSMKVMHPLPRVTEIGPEVDYTPHALYFRQAFNGVPVRMALMALIMGAIE